MTWIDYLLLIVLAYFIFKGARRGFIATIGAFIGIIAGAWTAGHYYDRVAQWLIEYWDTSIMLAIVVAFIGIYVLVNIVVGTAVKILTLMFHALPLGKTTNKLIGGVLGFAEGMLLIGLIIWVITLFPFENSFTNTLKESRVAGYFEASTRIVRPLLPKGLREIDFSFFSDLNTMTEEKMQELQKYMPDAFTKWVEDERGELQQQYEEQIQSQNGEEGAAP